MAGTGYVPPEQFLQQHRTSPRAKTKPAVVRFQYRGVSIKCGDNPCHSAQRLEGRRGLHSQIPKLPLSTCDAEKCHCRYEQHDDRRAGEDRRETYSSMSAARVPGQDDRRAGIDRRRSRASEDREAFRITYH